MQKKGLECCSDQSVSFHYVKEVEMRELSRLVNMRLQICEQNTPVPRDSEPFEYQLNSLFNFSLGFQLTIYRTSPRNQMFLECINKYIYLYHIKYS